MSIRPIDANNPAEIALVAQRMRDTLIEVEGPEQGATMYSLQWLEDRLRWHLDPTLSSAQVLVATSGSEIVGHTIFRIEPPPSDPFGLISTTYVVPSARRNGWATRFLEHAHAWFRSKGVRMSCTWTSAANRPLISLYQKFGYGVIDQGPNDLTGTSMIKLALMISHEAT